MQALRYNHAVFILDISGFHDYIPYGNTLRQHIAVAVVDTAPLGRQLRID